MSDIQVAPHQVHEFPLVVFVGDGPEAGVNIYGTGILVALSSYAFTCDSKVSCNCRDHACTTG